MTNGFTGHFSPDILVLALDAEEAYLGITSEVVISTETPTQLIELTLPVSISDSDDFLRPTQ
jgi:hypothetical protein